MSGGTRSTGAEEPEETGAALTAMQRLEAAALSQQAPAYALTLYVAGNTPHSIRAIRSVRRLCAEHLVDCHELEIIDIYQQPELAEREGILAVPTLIRKEPLPVQKLVGDMTDLPRVMRGLGLAPNVSTRKQDEQTDAP